MEVFRGSTPSVYPSIIRWLEDVDVQGSRAGDTKERIMIAVKSTDPRERWLTRDNANWAFGLQECFAYWNGLNPGHVERYNSNMESFMYDGKLHGSAYGRYLRNIPHDQIARVLRMLDEKPNTRRAVINIHQADVEDYDKGDVACTIYLQPFLRDGKLNMVANLRSQDMLWGYTYDTHAFQWIQEVMAGILDVDLGDYWHIMNSCHYYTEVEDLVIDTATRYTCHRLPDCRLPKDDLDAVMFQLSKGLSTARNGVIPDGKINRLERRSTFYADWLRMMTAYERHRFWNDEDGAERLKKEITTSAFTTWF